MNFDTGHHSGQTETNNGLNLQSPSSKTSSNTSSSLSASKVKLSNIHNDDHIIIDDDDNDDDDIKSNEFCMSSKLATDQVDYRRFDYTTTSNLLNNKNKSLSSSSSNANNSNHHFTLTQYPSQIESKRISVDSTISTNSHVKQESLTCLSDDLKANEDADDKSVILENCFDDKQDTEKTRNTDLISQKTNGKVMNNQKNLNDSSSSSSESIQTLREEENLKQRVNVNNNHHLSTYQIQQNMIHPVNLTLNSPTFKTSTLTWVKEWMSKIICQEKRYSTLDASKLKRGNLKSAQKNSNESVLYLIIFPLLFICIAYFCYSLLSATFLLLASSLSSSGGVSSSKTINSNNLIDFGRASESLTQNLDKLKQKYPKQTSNFWANIESTFKHSVLKAKDPSIVLIVNDKETSKLANSLTSDVFNLYLTVLNKQSGYDLAPDDLVINPRDKQLNGYIEQENSDKVKLLIDEKLKGIFNSGEKLALVKNVELIPSKSVMLFYTYGDDAATAKYPGVLILMTLELNKAFTLEEHAELLKKTSNLNSYVENYLLQMWSSNIGLDQLKPLMTRIANNVVLVNYED